MRQSFIDKMQKRRAIVRRIRDAAKNYLTQFDDISEAEQVTWTRGTYRELRAAMAELVDLDPAYGSARSMLPRKGEG